MLGSFNPITWMMHFLWCIHMHDAFLMMHSHAWCIFYDAFTCMMHFSGFMQQSFNNVYFPAIVCTAMIKMFHHISYANHDSISFAIVFALEVSKELRRWCIDLSAASRLHYITAWKRIQVITPRTSYTHWVDHYIQAFHITVVLLHLSCLEIFIYL